MSRISRRDFLKTGAATGALASVVSLPLLAQRGSASDMVTLGKSGVKVTRLAFGTGSNSGHIQQAVGQQEFTRMVRHAYDNGIRFFETSESYGASQQMLGIALKGLPRDSYQLMSKVTTDYSGNPLQRLDQLRSAWPYAPQRTTTRAPTLKLPVVPPTPTKFTPPWPLFFAFLQPAGGWA